MSLIGGVLLELLIIWFIYVLQKWRRSVNTSITAIEEKEVRAKKSIIVYLINVFSLGFLFFACVVLYFMIWT